MSSASAASSDPRFSRMVRDPARYFEEARKEARKEVAEAAKRERELARRKQQGR